MRTGKRVRPRRLYPFDVCGILGRFGNTDEAPLKGELSLKATEGFGLWMQLGVLIGK